MHKDNLLPILGALGGIVTVVLTLEIGSESPSAYPQAQDVQRPVEGRDTLAGTRGVKLACKCPKDKQQAKVAVVATPIRQQHPSPPDPKTSRPACCDNP
jgi:hypothetical protein